jgi:hypothetical protein
MPHVRKSRRPSSSLPGRRARKSKTKALIPSTVAEEKESGPRWAPCGGLPRAVMVRPYIPRS